MMMGTLAVVRCIVCFFFQAEDGIRDLTVTGVQTCALPIFWLGVVAVPLNTRLSAVEIDRVLTDANPRGLIRHSSLPVPTVQVSWQAVLDQDPVDNQSHSIPDPIYHPHAILALIHTNRTTGRPKGLQIRHAH